jgi:hypothetical protein
VGPFPIVRESVLWGPYSAGHGDHDPSNRMRPPRIAAGAIDPVAAAQAERRGADELAALADRIRATAAADPEPLSALEAPAPISSSRIEPPSYIRALVAGRSREADLLLRRRAMEPILGEVEQGVLVAGFPAAPIIDFTEPAPRWRVDRRRHAEVAGPIAPTGALDIAATLAIVASRDRETSGSTSTRTRGSRRGVATARSGDSGDSGSGGGDGEPPAGGGSGGGVGRATLEVEEAFVACRYPAHRPTDWQGRSGKKHCGICHPAAAGIAWVPAGPVQEIGEAPAPNFPRAAFNAARGALAVAMRQAPGHGHRLGECRGRVNEVGFELRRGRSKTARLKAAELIAELEEIRAQVDAAAAANLQSAIDALAEVVS